MRAIIDIFTWKIPYCTSSRTGQTSFWTVHWLLGGEGQDGPKQKKPTKKRRTIEYWKSLILFHIFLRRRKWTGLVYNKKVLASLWSKNFQRHKHIAKCAWNALVAEHFTILCWVFASAPIKSSFSTRTSRTGQTSFWTVHWLLGGEGQDGPKQKKPQGEGQNRVLEKSYPFPYILETSQLNWFGI